MRAEVDWRFLPGAPPDFVAGTGQRQPGNPTSSASYRKTSIAGVSRPSADGPHRGHEKAGREASRGSLWLLASTEGLDQAQPFPFKPAGDSPVHLCEKGGVGGRGSPDRGSWGRAPGFRRGGESRLDPELVRNGGGRSAGKFGTVSTGFWYMFFKVGQVLKVLTWTYLVGIKERNGVQRTKMHEASVPRCTKQAL